MPSGHLLQWLFYSKSETILIIYKHKNWILFSFLANRPALLGGYFFVVYDIIYAVLMHITDVPVQYISR